MPTVTFQILEGIGQGRVYRDLPTPVTIGRAEGNVLCLDDKVFHCISRFHAVVQFDNGAFILTDLKSTNGTRVNGEMVQSCRLSPGDQIRLGVSLLVFGSDEEILAHMTTRPRASAVDCQTDEEPSPKPYTAVDWRELRARLDKSHVFADQADVTGLHQHLCQPDSEIRNVLAEGFYRLVLLDAEAGTNAQGVFDLERFLLYVREELARVFNLSLAHGVFHLEDVGQVLKDEPRSLFCFINLQNVPIGDLRRLRGFTQEQHQALFTCRGRRALAAEEQEEERASGTIPNSSLVHAVAHPEKRS